MSDYNLLSLLQLTDSMLPIGAYAHSSGLETYVQQGIVKDLHSAKEFVTGMLSVNLHYTDAAFASLSYAAAVQDDWQQLQALDEECGAVKLPAEVRLASQKLGLRLLKTFQPLCDEKFVSRYKQAIHQQTASGHFCIAFGMCAAALKIPRISMLTGFYYNACAGMITNCVKLIPLGQQHGQEMLFSFQPLISRLVQDSLVPDLARVGLSSAAFDIRCMQHESLYSRLYMS